MSEFVSSSSCGNQQWSLRAELKGSGGDFKNSLLLRGRALRVTRGGPANPVFDERDELRIAPGPMVVAPSGVKNTPLARLAHPRVRLGAFVVAPFGEHDTVGVVLRVNIRFVPAFNRCEPLHH